MPRSGEPLIWNRLQRCQAGLLGALLLSALVLAGCERQQTPTGARAGVPEQVRRVVLIGPSQFDPQWPAIQGGARVAAASAPFLELDCIAPKSVTEADFAALVDDVLKAPPFAVALCTLNRPGAVEQGERLHRAGAKLITIGTRLDDAPVYGHVEMDMAGAAELLGGNLPTLLNGQRTYVLVTADDDALAALELQRFQSAAGSSFDARQLAEVAGGQDAAAQLAAALDRYRNTALVISLRPDLWLAQPPPLTLNPNGRFATMPAVPGLWKWLESGECAGLAGPLDGEAGRLAIALAIEAATRSAPAGQTRVVRSELVTRGNLADFQRRYIAAGNLPPGPP